MIISILLTASRLFGFVAGNLGHRVEADGRCRAQCVLNDLIDVLFDEGFDVGDEAVTVDRDFVIAVFEDHRGPDTDLAIAA